MMLPLVLWEIVQSYLFEWTPDKLVQKSLTNSIYCFLNENVLLLPSIPFVIASIPLYFHVWTFHIEIKMEVWSHVHLELKLVSQPDNIVLTSRIIDTKTKSVLLIPISIVKKVPEHKHIKSGYRNPRQ